MKLLLILFVLNCQRPLPDEGVLQKLDNSSQVASIQKIQSGRITFTSSGQSTELAIDQLRSFRREPSPSSEFRGTLVTTIDGSSVGVESLALADRVLHLTSAGQPEWTIASREVRTIVFKPQQVADLNDDWSKIQTSASKLKDYIVITRTGRLDSIEGLIRRIDQDIVEFVIDSETISVPRDRLTGLILHGAESQKEFKTRFEMVTQPQGFFRCESIDWDNGRIQVTLGCGAMLTVRATDVVSIDFAPGRQIAITELTPLEMDWYPLLASSGELKSLRALNMPRFNRAFNGEALSLIHTDSKSTDELNRFEKGIAMRSGSRVVYSLKGEFAQLKGTVGFAPTAHPGGNCRAGIEIDGRVIWEQELDRKQNTNASIDIDVRSANRLKITVDYLDGRSVGDELHFCELVLEK